MPSQVSPQELSSFFALVVQTLERIQLPYIVAGGFAAVFYGEPRLTIDIDIGLILRLPIQPQLPGSKLASGPHEWSTRAVRDAFFASPQFPKLLNIEAVKDTIANGVTNGILGYVGKPGDEYNPFYFETDLHAYDIEISDDMYIITKEVAEEYKKIHVEKPKLTSLAISPSHTHLNPGASETFTARGLNQHNRDMPIGPVTWSATSGTIDANGVFIADQDEGELTITASVGGVGGSATVAVRSGVVRQKEKTKVARQTKLTWSGSVPPQKWTNFYMKVLTKFASTQEINMDLTVTFTIEATGDEQLTEQKIEETKIALRELGLDDDVVVG